MTKDLEQYIVCIKEKLNRLKKKLEDNKTNESGTDERLNHNSMLDRKHLLEKHLKRLEKRLKNNKKKNLKLKQEYICIGHQVKIKGKNKEMTLEIVDSKDDAENIVVTAKSPLGKALLGKKVGEKVKIKTPKGDKEFVIEKIE